MAQTPPQKNIAAELIAQLRAANTPLARLRLVARAWRAIRNLSPQERMHVATQIGLEGADDLIEAIAEHQGSAPPGELIQAVNQVQRIDPATVKKLAAKMRDPRQRGQVVSQGLKALESALIGSEAPAATRPAAPPPPGTPPVVVKPATNWPLREAQPAPPKPPAKPAAPPAAAAVPAAPVVAAAPAPVVPSPPIPEPAAPPAPAPEPPKPPPTAAPALPAPAPAAVKPEPPREPPPPVRAALAERLAAVPALTARFRLLRRRIEEVRRLSSAELRSILEAFPDGWARRRALLDILAAGAPERNSDALSLLDALQSPGDRSWILGALADTRTLTAEEQTALLQAAPNASGRRRLELRLSSDFR